MVELAEAEQPDQPDRPRKALRAVRPLPQGGKVLLVAVTAAVVFAGVWSVTVVARAVNALPMLPPKWTLQVAVFTAVATLPLFLIEGIALAAETLAPEMPPKVSTRWFRNTGAFVGLIERPLLLGSLVSGQPAFVGVWLVFKGIAGYRLGLQKSEIQERRLFQLFLLNNALSLSGVAAGWLVWMLLKLPTL